MENVSLLSLVAIACIATSEMVSAAETFPKSMQGYWAVDQDTCKQLRKAGAQMVPPGREWLKISGGTIVGDSTMGKLRSDLVEIQHQPQMLDLSPAKFSAIMQTTWVRDGESRSDIEHFALSNDGQLFETIQGAMASSVYIRCK